MTIRYQPTTHNSLQLQETNIGHRTPDTPQPPTMITPLPFDSKLFGYPVGKVITDQDWNESEFLQEAEGFKLVYIFSKGKHHFKSNQFLLADTKVTLGKELKQEDKKSKFLGTYEGPWSDKLLDLAFASGTFSRFKRDPNFKQNEFQKLYELWVREAFRKKEMIILDDFSGFASFEVKNAIAKFGLMAIDVNHRGKGLGQVLVESVEQKTKKEGANRILISTQESNKASIGLYKKLDYKEVERLFVYHYWKS